MTALSRLKGLMSKNLKVPGWHVVCWLSLGSEASYLLFHRMRFFKKSTAHCDATRSPLFRSRRIWGSIIVAISLGFACSVPLESDAGSVATTNVCVQDAECRGGFCGGGICQRDSTELPALLLEVTPPSGTPDIAGIAFTTVVESFERGPSGYEIELGRVSRIRGRVMGSPLSDSSCLRDDDAEVASVLEDRSLPARVILTPRERLLGLPQASYAAEVRMVREIKAQTVDEEDRRSYEFYLDVPPGDYDIYVETLMTDEGCVRPPYLIVDQAIPSGIVDLSLELPEPESLGVTIRYPFLRDDLSDWTVDIVERDSGSLLSNQALLRDPKAVEKSNEYSVQLTFSSIDSGGVSAAELVRLSPPQDVVAPTLYVERSVVDLFQGGAGLIDQLTALSKPVKVSSHVRKVDDVAAAPAIVTLVATELQSTTPGTVAAFSRTIETDEYGYFEVEVLPGTYRISTAPLDSTLSRTEAVLVVTASSDVQVAKTIEVAPRSKVTGRVRSFSGEAVSGAIVWADAAPVGRHANVLDIAQGRVVATPSAVSVASESAGAFSLLADRGRFYFAARPEANTGFAWRIVLDVDVEDERVDLGEIILPLPVSVTGTLTSKDTGGALVSNALMRAYAFLKDGKLAESSENADSVIAVSETRVDSEGNFQLLLPSTL